MADEQRRRATSDGRRRAGARGEPGRESGPGPEADPDAPPASDDPLHLPLDLADPRFAGPRPVNLPERPRELVASRGPGPSPMDPRVRLLRGVIPALVVVAFVVIGAVFFRALGNGDASVALGGEAEVTQAVTERPRRVCLVDDSGPCAWLTVVDGRLLALSTSGSIPAEHGRQGVGWCPTSGYYGSNTTGSRYDPEGTVVRGPVSRGLDRFAVRVGDDGIVWVQFSDRSAGPSAQRGREPLPPHGAECETIPFDWNPDLQLD